MIPPETLDPDLRKVLDGIDEYVKKRNPKRRIKVLPSGPLRYVRIDLVLDERAGKDEIDEMLEEVRKMGDAKTVSEPEVANVLRSRRRFYGALAAFVGLGVPLFIVGTLTLLAKQGIYVPPLYAWLSSLSLPSYVWSPSADVVKIVAGYVAFGLSGLALQLARRRYARVRGAVA